MTARPLRLGLIGCGRIAEEGHLPGYRCNAGLAWICAVADPSAERRNRLGDLLGVGESRRYGHFACMLDREELDAVVVATPPALHRPAILAALASGCSVMTEKPLCLDLAELAEIEQAATRHGATVAVMHNYLLQPGWRALVGRVEGGEIGRPLLLRLSELSGGHWDESAGKNNSWREESAAGGGPLLDNLYHALYLSEVLLASPVCNGRAQMAGLLKPYRSGDTAVVTLEHVSGAVTTALASWCYAGRAAAVAEVAGESGVLRYRYWERPRTLELERPSGSRWVKVGGGAEDDPAGYGEAFRLWLEAVRDGRPPPHGLAQGRRVLEILDLLVKPGQGIHRIP